MGATMTYAGLPAAVDVVVIGAGLAGHCASLAAAETGATVLLAEKTRDPGGSTLLSAGSFALAGTDLQAAAGIEDTADNLESELHKVAGGRADAALVRLYADRQEQAYQWLKQHGVIFHKVSLSSGTAVPRTHPTDPRQLVSALHASVKAQSAIHYRSDTHALRLLAHGDAREVTGVDFAAAGDTICVHARRGVVIATGGFARSRDLVQRFAPELAQAPAWGGEGNTGDGLTMAWELGADLLDMGYVSGTFGVALNHYPDTAVRAGDELILRMAMYRGGIAVNVDAQRFADESQSYKALATRCLAQPGGIAIQVFDHQVMGQSAPQPTVNDLAGAFEKGVIFRADTLYELGHRLGIDGRKLHATVERYNRNVRGGNDDDFGRRTLGGGFGQPVPLESPPWYAYPCSAALLSTYCGLRVDTSMRVHDVRGRPLPRLHAAGEVVGGFHGAGYMSGSSLGKAVIFGLVAGHAAAMS
jgi:fumarate reductase flavoprotein subunit